MLSQWQIIVINTAIFFGHYVIISSALNFQFGNGGIPNMSSNVSVAVGAFTVSAVVIRLCMWIGRSAGLKFGADWVYDNPTNVRMLTGFFQAKPLLSLSLFLFSLAAAFTLGTAAGWLIGLMSGRLRATRLMMLLLIISNAVSVIAANNEGIAGGTLGAFIPNFFAWYQGEQMVIIATVMLVVGLVCYMIMRVMMNSPFGRLMRAVRENEVTLESTGKNVTNIQPEDRVAVEDCSMCGICEDCKSGHPEFCRNMYDMEQQPGMGEYLSVRFNSLYRFEGLDYASAALTEPLAVCVTAVLNAEIPLGGSVVVLGPGPLGLMSATAVRELVRLPSTLPCIV